MSTEVTPSKKLKITDYFGKMPLGEGRTTSNTSEASEDKSKPTGRLVRLSDVLLDYNLRDLPLEDDVYVFYQYPTVRGKIPIPLMSVDDFANPTSYIKLPHQEDVLMCHDGTELRKWTLVKKLLMGKIDSVYELEKAIKGFNPALRDIQFDILRNYVQYQMTEEEHRMFLHELLPAIIKLALALPDLIYYKLPNLEQGKPTVLFLSQHQISSLLANAFLCTYTTISKDDDRRCINFANLYSNGPKQDKKGCKVEKLKCLLNYFRRVTRSTPVGTVSYERHSRASFTVPEESSKPIMNLEFNCNQCMLEHGSQYSVVDFAHKFIGGGVLDTGCVQEEILFVVCPELIVAKMLNEKLLDNESVLITGVEQFNHYSGYAEKFRWKSSCEDCVERDSYGRRMRQIIAMDALYFSWRNKNDQYLKAKVDRELIKALSAFQCERLLADSSVLPAISTGNWGCGVFNGDPYLKTMIQIIAASEMKRDLVYFAFNNQKLKDDFDRIKRLLQAFPSLTVGRLYRIAVNYASAKRERSSLDLVVYLSENLP